MGRSFSFLFHLTQSQKAACTKEKEIKKEKEKKQTK